ncbi:MAG TPA: terminase small subunit, partial [Luteolibacter sp.]|nr:terminase small subunit [Luteolibacter sp.]
MTSRTPASKPTDGRTACGLSAKQAAFCREYLVDLNGTQAAIRAGYSEKTARSQAGRLLTKVDIEEEIARLVESAPPPEASPAARPGREETRDFAGKLLAGWMAGAGIET